LRAAAATAESNDSRIWPWCERVTIGQKYFDCQITTSPDSSPSRMSMPQSPGLALIARAPG
jgi:hypothetical protein